MTTEQTSTYRINLLNKNEFESEYLKKQSLETLKYIKKECHIRKKTITHDDYVSAISNWYWKQPYVRTCPDREMDMEMYFDYQQKAKLEEAKFETDTADKPTSCCVLEDIDTFIATFTADTLTTQLETKLVISNTPANPVPILAHIPTGESITKDARHKLFGGTNISGAASMKPENWQREMIEKYTGLECSKTKTRINLRLHKLENIKNPNTKANGFDYSEDFDGCQTVGTHPGKQIYINLKCIVGQGGSQTRSLREVYWFIEGQLQALIKLTTGQTNPQSNNIYFANILDGDCCHKFMPQFNYLLGLPEYAQVKKYIYVGDLHTYCHLWFNQNFKPSGTSSALAQVPPVATQSAGQ